VVDTAHNIGSERMVLLFNMISGKVNRSVNSVRNKNMHIRGFLALHALFMYKENRVRGTW